ncbi:MAG: hypothetical protein LAP87_09500 [Acidobacteriia bacterium]|nr:hypothetical protein [Terriglobia bacterium]
MSGAAIVRLFELVYLFGAGLTALKLFRSQLHRRYRVFFVYLLFLVPYTGAFLWLDLIPGARSNVYFYSWVLSAPLLWVFHILVVLALYRLILERHKGLYTLGRWAMYLVILVSVGVSALTLLPRITPAMPQQSRIMGYTVAAERGVDFALVMFLLLMLFLLTRYPVPLSRNVVVIAVVFVLFFLGTNLSLLLRNVFGLHLTSAVNTGLTGISAACAVAWLLLLNPQGEETRQVLPWIDPAHEQTMLRHLDALNAALLKVSRN